MHCIGYGKTGGITPMNHMKHGKFFLLSTVNNKCAAALRRGPTQCFSSHHNLDLHLWGHKQGQHHAWNENIYSPCETLSATSIRLSDNPWWALLLRGKLCNTNSEDTASKYSYTFLGNHCFTIISPRNWVRIQCTSTKNSRHKLHCIIIIIAPNFLRNHCIIILSPIPSELSSN